MSAPKSFTAGQQVYDIHGRAGSYVAVTASGYLVEPIFDVEEDDEPHYAEVETWREVFITPPTQRLTAEIAKLDAQISEHRVALRAVNDEIWTAKQERETILRHVKANPQLGDLHLWLEGKVTHIVAIDYHSVRIGTVEEILRSEDRDDGRKLRLLSLYVDPKANTYRIARSAYSDGSGNSHTPCLLASSEEHAKAQAREYIAKELATYEKRTDASWIRIAITYDVPVTDDQRKILESRERESAASTLKSAQNAVTYAQERLDAATLAYEKAKGGAA
jgi:hypothetical protein